MYDLSILVILGLFTLPLSGLLMLPYLVERMSAQEMVRAKVPTKNQTYRRIH